jgi:hypothetical protein
MRVLVQDCKTHEFYQGEEVWTLDASKAHDFSSGVQALEFCQKCRGNREVQIVMKFDPDIYDLSFPATEGCAETRTNGQKA